MTAELPGRPKASHPLLALTPQARRQLARTLVQGLAETEAAERDERRRAGLLGGATYLGLGASAFVAWHAVTGGGFGPFAAFYGLLGAVQGATTAALARQRIGLGPAAPVLDAPRALAAAIAGWASPHRYAPDRLLLAAGILVAARRPISRHLVLRLYGRAFPHAEVEEAIELLTRLGHLAADPEAEGVLALTRSGFQLLKDLGVQAPVARPRGEPHVAQHILPLFEALEGRSRRLPPEPEPILPAPAAPIVELPTFEPLPPLELPPQPVLEPIAALEIVEPPQLVPEPLLPPEEPEEDDELDVEEDEVAPEAPVVPLRRPGRWKRLVPATAAAVALAGLLAYLYYEVPNPLGRPDEVAVTTGSMPGPSRGVALQFNGKGKLLSSYGGGLFLSVPDRLDYKTPIVFNGKFDMATGCGLVSRPVSRAAASPRGRFLWCEMGPGDGPRERCLVDLETRTVTHDLVSRNPAYGLPGMLGWAGDQQMLMSEEAPPRGGSHWYLVDVTTHKNVSLAVPPHQRVMPVATAGGMTMLAGWDPDGAGWDLAVYTLDAAHTYQAIAKLRTTLPDSLKDTEPRVAAVTPDHRFLLATMRPTGLEMPAQTGSLVVISLRDGTLTPVGTSVPPLPDAPIFWDPEAQNGHYRFFYNGGGQDGGVPCTGDVALDAQ